MTYVHMNDVSIVFKISVFLELISKVKAIPIIILSDFYVCVCNLNEDSKLNM